MPRLLYCPICISRESQGEDGSSSLPSHIRSRSRVAYLFFAMDQKNTENGGWIVVSETKADGSCRSPEDDENDTDSFVSDEYTWSTIEHNGAKNTEAGHDPGGTSVSPRYAFSSLPIFQANVVYSCTSSTGPHSPTVPPQRENSVDRVNVSRHNLDPGQVNDWPTTFQRNLVPDSSTNYHLGSVSKQPDPRDHYSRSPEIDNVITPEAIANLFPHLTQASVEEWVHTCEKYRENAYSSKGPGNPLGSFVVQPSGKRTRQTGNHQTEHAGRGKPEDPKDRT
jgi:hypothetical protein